VVLIYLSDGYFDSMNCVRELLRALFERKPLIALLEPIENQGGMTREQIRAAIGQAASKYSQWGLLDELREWGEEGFIPPSNVYEQLFAHLTIDWSSTPAFQDVTLRLIAEQLLPLAPSLVASYELVNQRPPDLLVPHDRFHVYCSPHNLGAFELLQELSDMRKVEVSLEPYGSPTTPRVTKKSGSTQPVSAKLYLSSSMENLRACTHMLVYLTNQTWTRGAEVTAALTKDVAETMAAGVHLLLVTETPGEGQDARHAVKFDSFFATTPHELLLNGIFTEIATPLKGGPWRETSMLMLWQALVREPQAFAPNDAPNEAPRTAIRKRKSWSRAAATHAERHSIEVERTASVEDHSMYL